MISLGKNMKTLSVCLRQLRAASANAPQTTVLLAEPLTKRALVRVQGKEVIPFLQGLITNDMNQLHETEQQSMFAMFLNNSGRVLYDSIIYRTPDPETFLIECDREVSAELRRHLRMFRVRRKINIDCINSEFTPWVVYNPKDGGEQPSPRAENLDSKPGEIQFSTDPRLTELGVRVIQPTGCEIKDVAKLFPEQSVDAASQADYDLHRCANGVGEGIVDHPPGKCFPLEANCDFLHGISFHKGCYVGQELTARVYHTGVIRKRLMPLELSTEIDGDTTQVQTQAGAVVGQLRSVTQKRALALVRVEQVLNVEHLMIDGELCKAVKPRWWPQDALVRPSLRSS